MFKKLIVTLSVSTLSILFLIISGCSEKDEIANAQAKEKKYTIAVSFPSLDDKFMNYLFESIKKKGDELDVILITADAKNDTAMQVNQVENFVSQGVDAMIVIPVETTATKPMILAAKSKNIPFINANRRIIGIEGITSYVGSDDLIAGQMQAKELISVMGEKGNVALIEGAPGHFANTARIQGVKEVLSLYPEIKIVAQLTGYWQRADGIKVMENWIQSGLEINAVLGMNDEMAIGAAIAIEQAGKTGQYFVAGIDGNIEALNELVSGKLNATFFQNVFAIGAQSVITAKDAIEGKPIQKDFIIDFEVINKDNVDNYIKLWK